MNLAKYRALIYRYWEAIRKVGWEKVTPILTKEVDKMWPGLDANGRNEIQKLMWHLYLEAIE